MKAGQTDKRINRQRDIQRENYILTTAKKLQKNLNKNVLSLKLSSTVLNVGNRLKIIWKHFKGSLMTKKHCKGDTVELSVEANLLWTDSYEKLGRDTRLLRF